MLRGLVAKESTECWGFDKQIPKLTHLSHLTVPETLLLQPVSLIANNMS